MTKKFNSLDEIKSEFKGKGGTNPESESILVDNGADKAEGFVTIWSNRSDISKIIERCGTLVKSFNATESGAFLKIDRKAFRGIQYSFKTIKSGNKSKKSESTSLRMKKYWENKKKDS